MFLVRAAGINDVVASGLGATVMSNTGALFGALV
jgi:hypothetical protein